MGVGVGNFDKIKRKWKRDKVLTIPGCTIK